MKNRVITISFTAIVTIMLFTAKPVSAQLDFTWSGVCVNSPTQFTATGVSNAAIATWQWQFGDGMYSVLYNPQHIYALAGMYGVTLTVVDTSGITSSVTHYLIQNQLPVTNFVYNSPACLNIPVQFTDLSSTSIGYITQWTWNFGDGNTETVNFPANPNVSHWYSTQGTFNVTLIVRTNDLCENSITKPVTISPAPNANFIFSGQTEDQPVQFSDISTTQGTGNLVSWDWDFGDPVSGVLNASVLQNPTHVYSNPGTYAVSEIVTNSNSCKDTIIKAVVIYPATIIDFTFAGQCANGPTQFTAIINPANITQYNWQFGDGGTSTLQNPVHFYMNPGSYLALLTVTDNLGNTTTVTHSVVINPIPIANFITSQSCFGQTTQFFDLSQAGIGGITQWLWNFGDPASGANNTSMVQNPAHFFTSAGSFQVQLIVTSSGGCIDTIVMPLLVRPLPPVDFTVSNNCVNAPASFTPNASVMNLGTIASWLWDFGDGNTSTLQNPTHVYLTAGTFNVTLSVSDTIGCINSATKVLSIFAIPVASFSYTFPACAQSTVSFTDLSQTNGGGAIVTWQWNFGDPASGTSNTSTLQNPVHVFDSPGAYLVTLLITNGTGCSSSVTSSIEAHQKPTADFTFSPPLLNQPVFFTDQSLPGSGALVAWNWDFGDGNSSFLQNPVHTYTLPGTYSVGLTVNNEFLCSSYADSILMVEPGAGSNTLTGRVLAGSDTLSDANVHLIQLDGAGMPVALLTTSPGMDNEFVFNNIPEGNYYLHATPQYNGPFASAYLPTFYVNSVFWQSATLINLGQAQNPYNIQLASYQVVNGGTFIINGQIVNAGKSINPADQEVLLLDNQDNPIRWTMTDANGYFSFDSLPAGSYTVNPVITGITTFPYYVVLNSGNSPVFVKLVISGQIITAMIKTPEKEKFCEIFPNPAVEIITVKLNDPQTWFSVEIFSVNGVRLLSEIHTSENFCNINISKLVNGLYLIKIADNKGHSFTEKVIKK